MRSEASMKIHEYQAKECFKRYGIPVPREIVCATPAECAVAARTLGLPCVIKAQVLVGGRGKAGGVKIGHTVEEVEHHAQAILALTIKGLPVRKVLVAEAIDIAREAYLGMIVDRTAKRIVVMACREGGVEIEELARTHPGAIFRVHADPLLGLFDHHARAAARHLYGNAAPARDAVDLVKALFCLFLAEDASLAEINPLVLTRTDRLIALDAKLNFDDSAAFRHPEWEALRDRNADDQNESDARVAGLSFVKLEGNIGCVVNGAGLAMATMDILKYYGGQPANFLDIGGSSSPDKVRRALEILLRDPAIKVVFCNIFGGITRCDDVARGLLAAIRDLHITQPIVARLTGTNEQQAMAMLKEAGIVFAGSLEQGARQAIELAART